MSNFIHNSEVNFAVPINHWSTPLILTSHWTQMSLLSEEDSIRLRVEVKL